MLNKLCSVLFPASAMQTFNYTYPTLVKDIKMDLKCFKYDTFDITRESIDLGVDKGIVLSDLSNN